MDQLFSNKLSEQSFDVPEAFLADLNNKLDALAPAKKNKFPWFWSALMLLFGSALVTFIVMTKTNVNDANLTKVTNTVELNKNHDDPLNSEKNTSINVSSNSNLNSDNKENNNKSTNQNKPNSELLKTTQNGTVESTTKNNATFQKSVQSKNKSVPTDKKFKNPKIKSTRIVENGDETSIAPSDKKLNSSTVEGNKNNLNDKNDSFIDTNSVGLSNNANVLSNQDDDSKTQPLIDSTNSSSPLVDETNQSVNKPTKNKHFEAQFFGGYGISRSSIVSSNQDYSSETRRQESKKTNPDFGININYAIQNSTFSMGVRYFQTGEKYNYTTNLTTYYDSLVLVTIDSIYFDTLNNNFDTITYTALQNQTFNTTTTSNFQGINNYSWLGIPISFGYQVGIGKWAILPKIGINIEIGLLNSRGKYLNNELSQIVELSPMKFGLSYALQCELRREIKTWHVFVNPYFRSNFKPTIIGDGWERKYHFYGINFGVGIKF